MEMNQESILSYLSGLEKNVKIISILNDNNVHNYIYTFRANQTLEEAYKYAFYLNELMKLNNVPVGIAGCRIEPMVNAKTKEITFKLNAQQQAKLNQCLDSHTMVKPKLITKRDPVFSEFITLLKDRYPTHNNMDHAIKLIKAYEFIYQNLDFIEWAVANWWNEEANLFACSVPDFTSSEGPYQWSDDRRKGVLRTREDVSFHPCEFQRLMDLGKDLRKTKDPRLPADAKNTMAMASGGFKELLSFILSLKDNPEKKNDVNMILQSVLTKLSNSKGCLQGNTQATVEYLQDIKWKYEQDKNASLLPDIDSLFANITTKSIDSTDVAGQIKLLLEVQKYFGSIVKIDHEYQTLTLKASLERLAMCSGDEYEELRRQCSSGLTRRATLKTSMNGACTLSFKEKDDAVLFVHFCVDYLSTGHTSIQVTDHGDGVFKVCLTAEQASTIMPTEVQQNNVSQNNVSQKDIPEKVCLTAEQASTIMPTEVQQNDVSQNDVSQKGIPEKVCLTAEQASTIMPTEVQQNDVSQNNVSQNNVSQKDIPEEDGWTLIQNSYASVLKNVTEAQCPDNNIRIRIAMDDLKERICPMLDKKDLSNSEKKKWAKLFSITETLNHYLQTGDLKSYQACSEFFNDTLFKVKQGLKNTFFKEPNMRAVVEVDLKEIFMMCEPPKGNISKNNVFKK